MDNNTNQNLGSEKSKRGSKTLFFVIVIIIVALVVWYLRANPVSAPGSLMEDGVVLGGDVSDQEVISVLIEDVENTKPADFSKDFKDIEAAINSL